MGIVLTSRQVRVVSNTCVELPFVKSVGLLSRNIDGVYWSRDLKWS
jgi:hypothetical protein